MSDYIYGRNSVKEALKNGKSINKILLAEGMEPHFSKDIRLLCKQNGVVLQEVDRKKLDLLISGNHQGVIAEVSPFDYADIEDMLSLAAERNEDPLIVVLAEINDPHNLGAVLRTAECVGVHGVIIPKRRAAAVTETVAKVAAGALEYVPIARVGNLTQTLQQLKDKGFWIAGTDMVGHDNLWQTDLKGPLVIVLGSEGDGIPRLVKEQCDFMVQIPMRGNITSLNVSVSAGVVLYEVLRQRHNK